MSKFNQKAVDTTVTTNYEGEKAWDLSPEMALYTRVCTTFMSDQFYTPNFNDELNRIRGLIKKVDPVFVAQLAVYARSEMHLRSIPLVLVVELAKVHKGDDLIQRAAFNVIQRADELTEIMSYYIAANKEQKDGRDFAIMKGEKKALPNGQIKRIFKISKQLVKGIGRAFNKFDGYQLKKYAAEDKDVKLRDVLFYTHPVPKDDAQKALFDMITSGTLEKADTWETKSSDVGQKVAQQAKELNLDEAAKEDLKKAEARKMWEEKIDTRGKGELGYMALLRNLMNFLKYDVSMDHIKKVAARLADPKEVANGKQLPFRFVTAYRMLMGAKDYRSIGTLYTGARNYKSCAGDRHSGKGTIYVINDFKINHGNLKIANPKVGILLEALEEAVKYACYNIPAFGWETSVLIASDVSASMQKPISEHKNDQGKVIGESLLQNYDIGLALSMMLQYKCKNVSAGIFGDSFAVLPMPKDQILRNVNELHACEGMVGYSTNGYLVINYAISAAKQGIMFDKVFMFSDGQMWNSSGDLNHINTQWLEYKKINPKAKLYIFDTGGYGISPVNLKQNDVHMIAGWSDKVFDVIRSLDEGISVLDKIKQIKI